MADPKQLKVIRQGIEGWNRWRKDNPELRPDLSRASLRKVDLSGADLREANLRRADLRKTILREALLRRADLSEANLSGADLREAILARADLSEANLSGAVLFWADFSETILVGTDFLNSIFGWTILANVDLSKAKGFGQSTYNHLAPSTIGIDTLYKSNGQIPEQFLRDVGIPDNAITYAQSLLSQPFQFYSCFISYSSHDQAFAERLHADLVVKNLRCWFAPEDLKIGDRFQERIEESIRLFDKVMIVLSEASVQSTWVAREVNAAMEREDRDKRTMLFPIRIDDAVMDAKQPWAADIRRARHIGDFREWENHPSYVKALDRLLRDLKATDQ